MTKGDNKMLSVEETSETILGNTLNNLKELVIEYANTGSKILFTGAPGVGKELFSNLYAAACTNRPIIPINMTGIPTGLVDSILFGYEKGTYTGAKAGGAPGIITKDNASKMCFFFDELGDIPIDIQAKLLRFVQFGEMQKVGQNKPEEMNQPEQLRIVAATNKPDCIRDDLKDRFRCLRIPSLVERRHDIPLLLKHFTNDKGVTGITEYTLKGLYEIAINRRDEWSYIHPWKGNIRELIKVVEDAVFLCKKRGDTTLKSEDFPTFSWSHNVLEPGEQEINDLVDPPWMTPQILRKCKERYGSCEPYKDKSVIVEFKDLKHQSAPLPYHYFIKSIPGEVSKEDKRKEEIKYLRGGVDGINKTLSSINDKIPPPEPTQKTKITYDNTIPAKFENDFYDHHAKKDTPHVKIVEAYKKQRFSIDRKTVSERMQKALERTNPI